MQTLMQSSSSFARMMVSFCTHMEWQSLSVLLSDYVKRLGFGVKPEIIPLVEIRGKYPENFRKLRI
jgi:hypothetical protein